MRSATRAPKTSPRLNCETLEDRCVPALIFGLTTTNALVTFDSATPGTMTLVGAIAGVVTGDTVVGIDFRPATGQLYGLGVNATNTVAHLYTINPTTAAATLVGGNIALPQATGAATSPDFGFDFNPVADAIRVVNAGRDNFRLNATNGAITPDTILTPSGSTVVGAAYTNNIPGATSTTLYDIDTSTNPDQLVIQGGNPVPPGPSPAGGVLTVVGSLGVTTTSNEVGFDIGQDGTAYAALQAGTSSLYTVNLATGAATIVGAFGQTLRDISVAPMGTIAFQSATFSATETGPVGSVVLTRTGGSFGAITVTLNVTGGTATPGTDFTAGPYVFTFPAGAATLTLNIPLVNDTIIEGSETVTLAIASAPGATIGTQPTTTLTIADNDQLQPFRVAAGTGSAAPVVVAYSSAGVASGPFLPYGSNFAGGVRVAIGDVNFDGIDDIVTVPTVGAPLIKVFSGATGAEIANFTAYAPLIPAAIAVGDVNNDGYEDIVVTPATTIAAVLVFSGKDFSLLNAFLPGGGIPVGLTVAVGDMNNDKNGDIIVGTTSGTAIVAVFSGKDNSLLSAFLPGGGVALGLNVAVGNFNNDGTPDIVLGTTGGAGIVAVFSGKDFSLLKAFLPYGQAARATNVAVSDVNNDGQDDIITGTPSGASQVLEFNGSTLALLNTLLPFGMFAGGVFVG